VPATDTATNSTFVPAQLAGDTVESLHAMHGRPQAWIWWLVLLGCGAGLAALPLVEVDVTVQSPGVVRPATERIELKAPLGGRIARVLAHDTDAVAAGQVLIELAAPDLDERLARNTAQQVEKHSLLSALQALAGEPTSPAAVAVAALEQERGQLRLQIDANRLASAKARVELDRTAALAAKGIATQRELDDARFALERTEAEGRLLLQQTVTRWTARARDEQLALDQLRSEQARLEAERALLTVRSPAAGALVGFQGWSPGGWLAPGQLLGAVSPDDTLVVEAYVASRDAGLVRVGQAARLQVDAFPYTQWGTLDATVVALSGDVWPAGGGNPPVFRAVLRPAAPALVRPDGLRAEMRKGLTLQARFHVARRTLLQLLHDATSARLDPHAAPSR